MSGRIFGHCLLEVFMSELGDLTALTLAKHNFQDILLLNPEATFAEVYRDTLELLGQMDSRSRNDYESWLNKEILSSKSSDRLRSGAKESAQLLAFKGSSSPTQAERNPL